MSKREMCGTHTVEPLMVGKLMPVVGMRYVWNTICDQDMVAIGCTTPDEAKEVVDMSFDLLERRTPDQVLQATRSKASLVRFDYVYKKELRKFFAALFCVDAKQCHDLSS